jgi:prepilin-type N-terminal cleavage/methylation domain-containing protein
MKLSPVRPRRSGFTLLELVMAMAILSLIVGMVFGTARTSLALGNTIVKSQNEEMLHQAFFELLSQRFSALPGNTRFELTVEDSGSHYLSDLTLQNVPMSFTWGGEDRIAKAVQISTVKRRSGYLDVVLRYYENEILEGSESSFGSSALPEEPFAEILLIEDVAFFEWRVLDGRSMEWQFDWEIQGRLPLQIELTMAIGAQGEEIRQIFWVPPKQNPEVMMRQMMQGGGNGATGGGTPGGTPPVVIPGGGTPGGGRGGDGGGRGGRGGDGGGRGGDGGGRGGNGGGRGGPGGGGGGRGR